MVDFLVVNQVLEIGNSCLRCHIMSYGEILAFSFLISAFLHRGLIIVLIALGANESRVDFSLLLNKITRSSVKFLQEC